MNVAWFRFYAELNDFLPALTKGKRLRRHFDVSGSVKDLIESFGVPHTEVDLVLINGKSSAFTHPVRDGDHVSVYPVFKTLDVSSVALIRPAAAPMLQFVLDVHLGRLAAYLRMAGFDSVYHNASSDSELAATVVRERRVLLTRDRYLLMRSDVDRGYWIRTTDPKQQLLEVTRQFRLIAHMRPFTRCMKCNLALEPVSREAVSDQLPAGVRHIKEFRRCSACGTIYWEGTHHARMNKLLDWVKANAKP